MDGLSVASGIAGLVSLADVVVRRLVHYVSAVKNAKESISALLFETSSLLGVLQSLKLLAEQYGNEDAAYLRLHHVRSCQETLERLRSLLGEAYPSKHKSTIRGIQERLHWPLSKPVADKYIQELERHKSTLSLSLSADSLAGLLRTLSRQNEIESDIKDIKAEFQKRSDKIGGYMAEESRQKILSFFEKVSPKRNQEAGLRLLQPGTGVWLLDSEEFKTWLSATNSKLWIYGIPGAGKTILMALTVSTIQEALVPENAMAYFYCDYKDPESQEPINILGSLAKQLAIQDIESFIKLKEFYEQRHKQGSSSATVSPEDLRDFILEIVNVFDKVFIIVDGLDECTTKRSYVVELLSSLNDSPSSNISTLFASRNEIDIRTKLGKYVEMSIAARTSDLRLYVAAELQKRTEAGQLVLRRLTLKEHIMDKLVEKAQGMFRWVTCQIDYLCELSNDKERRQALDSLPPTLSETYERILTRVNSSNPSTQRVVQRALRWIAYAQEPLSLCSLAEAVSVEPGDEHLDPEEIVDTTAILKWCSSLVRLSTTGRPSKKSLDKEVRHDDNIIEFAHFTVKEYLLGIDPESSSNFQAYSLKIREIIEIDLTRTCLTYLCMDNFASQYPRNKEEYAESTIEYPFYQCAAFYWTVLGKNHFDDGIILALSCRLFSLSKSHNFMRWGQEFYCHEMAGFDDHEDDRITYSLNWLLDSSPLHWACIINASELCCHLIKEGADVNKDSYMGYPLYFAIVGPKVFWDGPLEKSWGESEYFESKHAVLKLLTEAGAGMEVSCINSLDTGPMSLMELALKTSTYEDCALLIKTGAILDKSALEFMLSRRHEEVESENSLVDLVGIRNLRVEDIAWFMEGAIRSGNSSIRTVREITNIDHIRNESLDNPANVDDLNNTLSNATECGQVEVVKELFKNFKLNVNHANRSDGKSLLHLATSSNFPTIVALLLSLGATPLLTDNHGATPLHLAAKHQDGEALKILLKAVRDIGTKDNNGLSVLHVAALHGSISAMKALHESRLITDEHYRDRTVDGRTLLLCAAEGGSVEVIRFLVVFIGQTTLSEISEGGSTALHYSAQALSPSATRCFLQHGLYVDAEKSDKSTALHTAAAATARADSTLGGIETRAVLEILLNFNANINAQRADGKTALHILCESSRFRGHERLDFALLLQRGAIVNITDKEDCTPLHRLLYTHLPRLSDRTSIGKSEIDKSVKDLLERGMDVSLKDHKGESPISLVLRGWESHLQSNHRDKRFREVLMSMLDYVKDDILRDYELASMQPLNRALEAQDEGLVDRLLCVRCDVDRRDRVGKQFNAIEQACHIGCPSKLLMRLIKLSKKKSIKSESHNGLNLLHIAARAGHEKLVVVLLDLGFGINDFVGNLKGETALMVAATRYGSRTVETLLGRNADKTLVSSQGWTALHYTAIGGNVEAAQLLRLDEFPAQATIKFNTWLNGFKINPFHLAAWYGQRSLIDHFLATHQDLNVNTVAKFKLSALHLAACAGKTPLVRHLISIGAMIDAVDDYGMSPLHFASIAGHLDSVHALLEYGADPDLLTFDGMSGELLALQHNNRNIAEAIRSSKTKHSITPKSELGFHPSSNNPNPKESSHILSLTEAIFRAISKNDLSLCEKLIDAGANINGKTEACGCNPLLFALCQRQPHIAEFLIRKGALDKGETCRQHLLPGFSAISLAAACGYTVIVQKLLHKDHMGKVQKIIVPMQSAAVYGRLDCLKIILDFNETELKMHLMQSEKAKNSRGHLPKPDVCNERIVEEVDNHDITIIQPHTQSWDDEQSSHDTVSNNSEDSSESIFNIWDPKHTENLAGNLRSPALHLAAESNFKDVVAFLIHKGAPLEAEDLYGHTALLIAAGKGFLEIVKSLIDSGAEIDSRSHSGKTAAMYASLNGSLSILYLLYHHGADFTLKDHRGRGALDYAILSGKLHIISCLMAFGQKICWLPDQFCTPLCASVEINSPELQNFLLDFMPNYSSECRMCEPLLLKVLDYDRSALLKKLIEKLRENGLLDTINKSKGNYPPALCAAASLGDVKYMQTLLDSNADIEVCWEYVGTPLGVACSAGHLDSVKHLIERGAKTSWTESDGKTITAMERSKGHRHVIQWLQTRKEHSRQNEAIATDGPATVSPTESTGAETDRPQLKIHLISRNVIKQSNPIENHHIRRRPSFILDYALHKTTTIWSPPTPQEPQLHPKRKPATRSAPTPSPESGTAIRKLNKSVYSSAIDRKTALAPPIKYEMYPLIERVFQVDERRAWELF